MEIIRKPRKVDAAPSQNYSDIKFDPEKAKRLRERELEKQKPSIKERFVINPAEYPIFSQQGGVRDNEITGTKEERQLSIEETLGIMVGDTAKTIATITGEDKSKPAADHVIYLDKSARPVSWMVDDFWNDFTDKPKPEESFLAIDRRQWFPKVGIKLEPHEQIRDSDGKLRPATGSDFWREWEKLPPERQKDYLARIRALYIDGGIEEEDPDKIMSTPTRLDGKNLLIIDEVSRTGSTLDIAKGLLKLAIPDLESVEGHVFWKDTSTEHNNTGETQMGKAPVWYPDDPSDWRGRGVKDINPEYYRKQYEENPNNITRAEMYGSFVLGEPLRNKEDEPGQLSWKLREEMKKIHQDYQDGHILPDIPSGSGEVGERIVAKMEGLGVEFMPEEQAKGNPNARQSLIRYRNRDPKYD